MSDATTMPCVASTEEPLGGPPSMPWCVDRGAALEAMSTTALWRALELGLLPPETRVWREGMECWTPARQVRELRWTVSRLCAEDAAEAQERGGQGLVSAGLTPAELGTVKHWAASSAPPPPAPPPGSNREQRAEMPTLLSTPEPSSQRRLELISLDLPASFPEAPMLPRVSAPAPAPEPLAGPTDEAEGAALEAPTPVAPVVDRSARAMALRRFVERLAPRRDALFVTVGAAVALLAIGAALAEPAPARASVDRAVALAPEAASTLASVEAPERADSAAGGASFGGAAGRAAFGVAAGRVTVSTSPAEGAAGVRWGERGQHRQRRGHAERRRGVWADAAGAERAKSR